MKRKYIILLLAIATLLLNCNGKKPASTSSLVIPITNSDFKVKIADLGNNLEWKFKGGKPVLIDFYATWCGPCRMLSPIVEELAKEYEGKIVIYNADVDEEKELAKNLGISNLPTLLFIPMDGKPQISEGYLSKADLKKAIASILKIN